MSAAASAVAPALDADQLARLRGLRVLHIKDELDIAEGVRLMLLSLGVSVDMRQP